MDFKLAVFVCLALGYAYVISQKLDAHSNVCFRDRFQCECNQTNTTVEIMRQQHVQIIDITNRLQTSEKKIQELEGRYRQILLRLERLPGDNIEQPTDCQALQMLNMNNSLPDGVYTISPSRGNEVLAYCDMSDGGWTVFQRRFSGEENFYRNWKDYREGFGDPAKEYWLGNEFLHELSRDRICSLKIEMVNWDDLARYAEYTDFNIDNETEGFRLHVGEYSGDARQFTFSPEDISACVGDEIQLNWQYMGTPIIKHCHKDGKVDVITIISSPVIHSTYDGRLIYNGQGNITILNVETTDSGTYVFEILYDLNRLFTDAVNVKVYDSIRNPPNIEYDDMMNKLSCSVDGNTEETSFIWKLNGDDISTNPEISPTVSGLYMCNVSSVQIQNCLHDEVNATAVLYLTIGVPKVQVRFPLVKIRIRMSATLECYVEESTPLVNKWKWYKKDNEERILSDAASIHIPYVTDDDTGEYVCIASNAIGDSDPETIQLQILQNGNITDENNPSNSSEGNDTIFVVSLVLSCLVVIFIICATLGWFLYRKRCQTMNNGLEDNYFGRDNVSTITESTLSSTTMYMHYHQIRDGSTGRDTGSSSYASVDSVRPINGDNSDVVTITSNISSEGTNSYMEWNAR